MKIKAPNWFIKLHEEAIKERKDVFNYLSKKMGYAPFWCEKNLKTCFQKLNTSGKIEIIEKLTKIDTIFRYAWNRFTYEYWDKCYQDKVGLIPAKYNKKKKEINISKTNISKTNKIKKVIKSFITS